MQVVLYRGHLPCDVLFIGEAPGDSEDVLGHPFRGPAGERLDALIEDAWNRVSFPAHQLDLGFTNIVACRPLKADPDELSNGTLRPPTKEEAAWCSPRLGEIVQMANPKLIVKLGKEAARFTPTFAFIPNCRYINLVHPSAILRMADDDPSGAALAEKRFSVNLAAELELLNG